MTNARQFASVSLVAMMVALGGALGSSAAHADAILSGTIASTTGEKLGGVAVSAKAEGSVITMSVYTDESGAYYFPPLPDGHYRVWTNAVKFENRARQRHNRCEPPAQGLLGQADHQPGSLDQAVVRRRISRGAARRYAGRFPDEDPGAQELHRLP